MNFSSNSSNGGRKVDGAIDSTSPSATPGASSLPYVGPRPYDERDERCFFGRTGETRDVVSLLLAHPLVLLYSASGAGKSSLINAGLIPKLREHGCEILPARVTDPRFASQRLEARASATGTPTQITNVFVYQTLLSLTKRDQPSDDLRNRSLSEFLFRKPPPNDDEGDLPPLRLLIFDQFEELFTTCAEFWDQRPRFFQQLRQALDDDAYLHVLLAMREEHLGSLECYFPLLPDRGRIRFHLERLRVLAATKAVEKPVEFTSRRYAQDVAGKLVLDLSQVRVDTPEGTAEVAGEFIDPVQLQVVCQTLWHGLKPEVQEITFEHLKTYGDITQALGQFYDHCLQEVAAESLAKGVPIEELTLRRWFQDHLITPDSRRGIVYEGPHDVKGIPREVVRLLENRHLIRLEPRAGGNWYELPHDRLISPIRDSNERRFRQEEQRKLEHERRLREEEQLQLETERQLRQENQQGLEREQELRKLKARELEELEQRTRKAALLVGITALVLLFAFIGWQWWDATQKVQLSNRQSANNLSVRALALLEQEVDDPAGAAILFKSAMQLDPSSASLNRQRLAAVVVRLPRLLFVQAFGGTELPTTTFSPQGDFLLLQKSDGVEVYNTGTGKQVPLSLEMERWTPGVVPAVFSEDGQFFAVSYARDKQYAVRIWKVAEPGNLQFMAELSHPAPVTELVFTLANDAHRQLVTVCSPAPFKGPSTLKDSAAASIIQIWNCESRSLFRRIDTPGHISLLAVARAKADRPDRPHRIAAVTDYSNDASGTKSVVVWELVDDMLKPPTPIQWHENNATRIAFNPSNSDSVLIELAAFEATPQRFELRDLNKIVSSYVESGVTRPEQPAPKLAVARNGRFAKFSNDGGQLVVGDENTAELLTLSVAEANGEMDIRWNPATVFRHPSTVLAASFSPDGRFLITGSRDKKARVWKVGPTGEPLLLKILDHTAPIGSVMFDRGGGRLLTVDTRFQDQVGVARIWDFMSMTDHVVADSEFAYLGQGRLITNENNKGRISIHDLENNRDIKVNVRQGAVARVVTNVEGDVLLAVTHFPDQLLLWPILTIETRSADDRPYLDVADAPDLAAFSPDGHVLVTINRTSAGGGGAATQFATVWDIEPGQTHPIARRRSTTFDVVKASDESGKPRERDPHTEHLLDIAVSPDGRRLATASEDDTARLWSLETGQWLATFKGHVANVMEVAFGSPNRLMLLTASADGTACLWPADSQGVRLDPTLRIEHGATLLHAEMDQDGKRILTVGQDNLLRLWLVTNSGTAVKPISVFHHRMLHDLQRAAFSPTNQITALGWRQNKMNGKQIDDQLRFATWSLEHDSVSLGDYCFLAAGRQFDRKTSDLIYMKPAEVAQSWQAYIAKHHQPTAGGVEQRITWHREQLTECKLTELPTAREWHLTRLLELSERLTRPERREWMIQRGLVRESQRRWPEAIQDLTDALQLQDERGVRLQRASWCWVAIEQLGRTSPRESDWVKTALDDYEYISKLPSEDWLSLVHAAEFLSDHDRTEQAKDAWGQAAAGIDATLRSELDPHKAVTLMQQLARAKLGAHDRAGYLATCRALVERSKGITERSPELGTQVALTCSLVEMPSNESLLSECLQLTRKFVADDETWRPTITQALLAYRAGEPAVAVRTIGSLNPQQPESKREMDGVTEGYYWVVHAILFHEDRLASEEALRKLQEWRSVQSKKRFDYAPLTWEQRVDLRVLEDEARRLLETEPRNTQRPL